LRFASYLFFSIEEKEREKVILLYRGKEREKVILLYRGNREREKVVFLYREKPRIILFVRRGEGTQGSVFAVETLPCMRENRTQKNRPPAFHLYDITQKNRDTARRMNGVERARGLRSENGTSKDRISSTKDLVKTSDRISEHKGNTEEPSPC